MWRERTSRTSFGESSVLVTVVINTSIGSVRRSALYGLGASADRGPELLGQHRGGEVRILFPRAHAPVFAELLGPIERRVGRPKDLVLLLFDGRARRRMRPDRGNPERRRQNAVQVQGGIVEPVWPREERRGADCIADRVPDLHPFPHVVPRQDEDELVSSVTGQRRTLVRHGPAQEIADLAQDLAAGE